MKQIIISVGLLLLLVLAATCSSPTETISNNVSLSVDVSCTEAWLNLSVNNVSLPKGIRITKDGKDFIDFTLTTKDTILYDSTPAPNRSYTYQATINSMSGQSDKVIATTLDTTSNKFSWQTFTFGDTRVGGSMLYDVSIVNDTLAYAVGEIYMKDSTGQPDPLPYNFAKWNGKEWKLKKVVVDYKGNPTIAPLTSIFVLQDGKIILSSGLPYLPDNNGMWKLHHLWDMGILNQSDGSVNHIWGTSINDLFFVGNKGTIVHYSNGSWQRIESGTTLDLYDIYSNNGKDVYVSGGNFGTSEGILLKGNSSGFQILKEGKNISAQLFNPYFAGIAKTVWVSDNNNVYFGGNLLYRYKNGSVGFVKSLPGNSLYGNVNGQYWGFLSMIRGEKDNDIMLVGEGNTIRHFNGVRWQQLGMAYDYTNEYTWLSVAQKEDITAVVGRSNSQGIIMILKRNEV